MRAEKILHELPFLEDRDVFRCQIEPLAFHPLISESAVPICFDSGRVIRSYTVNRLNTLR